MERLTRLLQLVQPLTCQLVSTALKRKTHAADIDSVGIDLIITGFISSGYKKSNIPVKTVGVCDVLTGIKEARVRQENQQQLPGPLTQSRLGP